MTRYVEDIDSRNHLVFPDRMNVVIESEDVDDKEAVIVFDAQLVADPAYLENVKGSRQISVEEAFFILRKPTALQVSDFQFVKTGPLSGRVVLSVKAGDSQVAKDLATSDVTFFDPEYSGTSELYTGLVEVAKANLPAVEIEKIRTTDGVVNQISKLTQALETSVSPADLEYVPSLGDLLLSRFADIQKNAGQWQIILPPGEQSIVLREEKEIRTRISGSSEEISIK